MSDVNMGEHGCVSLAVILQIQQYSSEHDKHIVWDPQFISYLY